VGDVTTTQNSTVVVTYTDEESGEEIVAGVAAADRLSGAEINVEIQDAGGFPGEHTAWVFDDADLPADLSIGDDATPVAPDALDSETALVQDGPFGELSFENQILAADGTVSVADVTTTQNSTVVVTYTDEASGEEVVAGVAAADRLNDAEVNVEIQDAGGFPGEHTAWVFDDADLPADLSIGDDATPVAPDALDSETALVEDEPFGELSFENQILGPDGTVSVADVTTTQNSTVVVTYTDEESGEEIVAGVAAADRLSGAEINVEILDAGGFPGEHTAWVFDDADLPADLSIGDDATPVADAALDFETAVVEEAARARFEITALSVDEEERVIRGRDVTVSVTVENVGVEPGTGTLSLSADGALLDTQDLSLAVGATATETFEVETDGITLPADDRSDRGRGDDPGATKTRNVTLTAEIGDTIETATVTVRCVDPPGRSRGDPSEAICGQGDDDDDDDDNRGGRGRSSTPIGSDHRQPTAIPVARP